jgi:hypothetical protein
MSDWLDLRASQFGVDTFIPGTSNSEVFMPIVRCGIIFFRRW